MRCHRERILGWWPALALMFVLSACAGPRLGVEQWQGRFEEYVRQQANGDLNFLRGMEPRAGRRTFAVHGAADPDTSTDVSGIWLGSHRYDGRRWQFFLVGVVEQHRIADIRLAAVTRVGERLVWQTGPADESTLARYRSVRTDRGLEPADDSVRPGAGFVDWPAPGDDYALEVDGATVRVVERRSEARWSLTLTPVKAASSGEAES